MKLFQRAVGVSKTEGWIIDPRILRSIAEETKDLTPHYADMETVEGVLIALENTGFLDRFANLERYEEMVFEKCGELETFGEYRSCLGLTPNGGGNSVAACGDPTEPKAE